MTQHVECSPCCHAPMVERFAMCFCSLCNREVNTQQDVRHDYEERRAIAVEILRQLGGRKFVVMTGARDFVVLEDGAQGIGFHLPWPKINTVRIELSPMDLYDITFSFVRGQHQTIVSQHDGIYAENLVELFERETGLQTHVPRIIY